MSDEAARRAIAEDLDVTLVVEASAGTGKTSALVTRMLALIGSGRATLSCIVAVTFTDKAAGEMKLRLRTELEGARARADALSRPRYEQALAELETAHIATIHAFCADLLRKRPIEAGIDPEFAVLAEDNERELLDQVFERWLQTVLERPPSGVRRALKRRGGGAAPSEKLRRAALTLIGQRDFTAPWARPALDRDREVEGVVQMLLSLADLGAVARDSRDTLAVDLCRLGDALQLSGVAQAPMDHDAIEHALLGLLRLKVWKRTGRGQWFADGLLRADVVARRGEALAVLEGLCIRLEADLAAQLREDLRAVVDAFERVKQEQGALDFLDLLLCTRTLLTSEPAVRAELQAGISHVFIDECQDIDPLQLEILLALAGEPGAPLDAPPARGKLFIVGDPKQSIYSFRRADVALYERLKARLVASGARVVQLTRSFRATDALQHAINAAFAFAMKPSEHAVQALYAPLEPVRAARPEQPSLIALSVPRPYGAWGELSSRSIAESTADAVAAFVDFLVSESGFVVEERGQSVPIQHRHVLLLFRSTRGYGRDLTRAYSRALEARQIPHVLSAGRSLHMREEVMALCALLSAVELPEDELSVYSALRGPFFALTDSALVEYRAAFGRIHPLAPRLADGQASASQLEVEVALDVLAGAHYARNKRPLAHTIERLLQATRAHAGLAFWPGGEQALANVQRIVDDARRFDTRAATSFRAFVTRLRDQVERGEGGSGTVLEEGADGVRIMTVHGAKGLEHPIVILCEPTSPRRDTPSRYVDVSASVCAVPLCDAAPLELHEHRQALLAREHAEEVRIAYVAATRARDMLVVPCVGDARVSDARAEGWVDVLHPAFYPRAEHRRSPRPAPSCPAFGDDSVLQAPVRARRQTADSVAPGEHVPQRGAHRVVWWDPKALQLDRVPLGGIEQHALLQEPSDRQVEARGADRLAAFESRRAELIARASSVRLRSVTVTELSKPNEAGPLAALATQEAVALVGDTPAVAIARVQATASSAGPVGARGPRFGTLVHAVVASLLGEHVAGELADPDALRASLAASVRFHGRLLGASEPEMSAAQARVLSAWDHVLLVRARSSRCVWVEHPLCFRLPDGTLVEGTLDLAFEEPDGSWTVVDLKTDEPAGNAAYVTQVALYARAVSVATGRDARAVLLGL